MWIVGHAQVGWFLARAAKLESRDRRLVTACAVLPDLDGLTLLGGLDAYLAGHHVYLHNVLAIVLLPALALAFARRRVATGLAALGAVLLHLGSDGLGFLELRPLWPFSRWVWWPNDFNYPMAFFGEVLVPLALLAWGLSVFRRERLSVLELISPRVDRAMAGWLERHAQAAPAARVPWTGRMVAGEIVVHLVLWAALATICHFLFLVYDRPRGPAVAWMALAPTLLIRWLMPWLIQRGLRAYARSFAPRAGAP